MVRGFFLIDSAVEYVGSEGMDSAVLSLGVMYFSCSLILILILIYRSQILANTNITNY